jgi:hypothetical protein
VVGLVHGWEEANVNLLTNDRHTDPVLATPALRSALCRIRGIEAEPPPVVTPEKSMSTPVGPA